MRTERQKAKRRARQQRNFENSHEGRKCTGTFIAWDCGCSFGCDCCRFHKACDTCGEKRK